MLIIIGEGKRLPIVCIPMPRRVPGCGERGACEGGSGVALPRYVYPSSTGAPLQILTQEFVGAVDSVGNALDDLLCLTDASSVRPPPP